MQGGLVRPAFAVLSAGILESTVNTETEKDRFMSENTKNPAAEEFLPVCKADMLARGWRDVDFVLVTGDAYVDHPSFAPAANGVTPSRVFNFLTASTNSSYVSGSLAPALSNNVLLQNNVIYHENIGVEYNFPSYSNADVEPSTILDLTSSVK